jgi:TolB-like protein
MPIWSSEIKELETLYSSVKGRFPELEKDLEHLIKTDDENVALLYSRRCLEIIVTYLCEYELKRPRKTEPLKGIIDKLNREEKVPSHIIVSMQNLNSLSTFGTHPKEFDPEQVKPVLNNLTTIIKWYLKYKDSRILAKEMQENVKVESKEPVRIGGKIQKPKKKLIFLLPGLFIIIAVIIILLFLTDVINPKQKAREPEKSIAVLPFKLLSDEPDKQYLADGMMDAILLHLSKIEDFRVMSRTSTEKYRVPGKTMTEIGRELGVEYLLEGSFQKYSDNVRLIVQLIRTGKEGHVWANEYNEKWQNIFSVQSEVARSIAEEIKGAVSPEEKLIFESAPTSDLQAYDYYLRGNDYSKRSYEEVDQRYAIQMYEKAVEIDPDFALAWVGLAASTRDLYWHTHYKSEENISMIKKYLDKALSISPELKEVRLEEARYYYHCKLDYVKSIELLEKLKTEFPKDDEIYAWTGYVYRRMGEFRKSLENIDYAISLNPSNWDYWWNASVTLVILREYGDAEKYIKKVFDLNPSYSLLFAGLVDFYINTGQIKKAREFLAANEKYIDSRYVKLLQANIESLDRNYERAIQILQTLTEDPFNDQSAYYTKHLWLGLTYYLIPDNATSVKHFEMERDFQLKKINETKNDPRFYQSLGIAYAGLGMKEEALEAGKKALEILDFSKDAHGGFDPEMDMVRILVMVGEFDEAMARLNRIFKYHGGITAEILKLDPFWDPVRNHEKFKEIISNPAYQVNL